MASSGAHNQNALSALGPNFAIIKFGWTKTWNQKKRNLAVFAVLCFCAHFLRPCDHFPCLNWGDRMAVRCKHRRQSFLVSICWISFSAYTLWLASHKQYSFPWGKFRRFLSTVVSSHGPHTSILAKVTSYPVLQIQPVCGFWSKPDLWNNPLKKKRV